MTAVTRFQRDADPFSKMGRRPTKVHRDVENGAAYGTNKLSLRLLELKMQAAQYVAHRPAVIVLHERGRKSKQAELILAKDLGKKAARIAEYWRANNEHARK